MEIKPTASRDAPVTRGGARITDEVAEALAREAEAGYDINPQQIRPGPGRKSLAGGSGKSPAIQVRLAPDRYERVKIAAAEAGQSLSEFVRDAIDRELRRVERASRR